MADEKYDTGPKTDDQDVVVEVRKLILMKEMPKYKKWFGKQCVECHSQIICTARYDKRESDGILEFSYLGSLCQCGLALMYRNGSWGFIPKKDFDKNRLVMDDIRQSGIEPKSSFKQLPIPSV